MNLFKEHIDVFILDGEELEGCPYGLVVGLDAFKRGLGGGAVTSDIPEPDEGLPPRVKLKFSILGSMSLS